MNWNLLTIFKEKKNRSHPKVGSVLYSLYFGFEIKVVAYNGDNKWWFTPLSGINKGKEYLAASEYSYMEGLELVRYDAESDEWFV